MMYNEFKINHSAQKELNIAVTLQKSNSKALLTNYLLNMTLASDEKDIWDDGFG